ncbi:MAG: hypothetical protein IPP72_13195 [Chitinophagaceae bacterium]|nr:hypothetical protein [Chitinophagaceae bacterium]
MQILIDILLKVKKKITDDSDLMWTSYEHAATLRKEIDDFVDQLKRGDFSSLDQVNLHFLPTGTFQEHSLMNGWSDEYLQLSASFDKLYEYLKINR